ncbi:hypothetical protein [Estrella lausannensis]|uniref:Conserved putative membrane protein n=1 Tax=Estrella lausannensis TaxID=483423 RepID=A0A0H5DP93_9BACT|nr:hypothetical protein [Estrella lausannensis]CRX38207.1 Conserved putative membrane protein [Estrella lausannensis]
MNIFGYFFGGKPATEIPPVVEERPEPSARETQQVTGTDERGRLYTEVTRQTTNVENTEGTPSPSTGFFGGLMNVGGYVANTAGIAGGYAANAALKAGAFAAGKLKQGTHGAVKWALFTPEGQQQFKDNLVRISGNERLVQVVDAITPGLAQGAFQLLDNHPYYSYLKPLYDGENDFVENLLKTVLLKIVSNTATDIEQKALVQSGILAEEEVTVPNLTVAVLSNLAEVVKGEFDKIALSHSQYQELMDMEDGEEKTAAIREIFRPGAEQLLRIGFPGGAADLKINSYIQDWAFSSIQNALADYLQVIYQQTVVPSHHEERDLEVFKAEGGQALKALAKMMADKGTDGAKTLIKQNKDFIVGFLDPVLQGRETALVKAYLATELEQLAGSNDQSIQWLFTLLHNNLTSFSVRILSKLAETSPDQTETNVTAKALKNLLTIGVNFFGEDGKAFDIELARINKLTDEKEIQAEKQKLFNPFIEEFLKKTGLEGNPMVEKFKESSLPYLVETLYTEAKKIYPDQSKEKAALERALNSNKAIEGLKKETAHQSKKNKIQDRQAQVEDSVELPDTLSTAFFGSTTGLGADSVAILPKQTKGVTPPTILDQEIEADLVESLLEVDEATDKLELGCGAIAKDIKEVVIGYITKNKEAVADAFASYLGPSANNVAGQELADALAKVLGSSDTATEKTLEFAESTLKTALFKIFVLVADNAKEQALGENKKDPVAAGLHKMLSLVTKKIPSLEPEVKNIMNSQVLTKEEKDHLIVALFNPVAIELLAMAGVNEDGSLKVKDALPIPEILKPFALKAITQSLLPQLMSRVYLDITSSQYELEKNQEKLAALVPSAQGSIKTVADYIAKYVPFYLKTNADTITNLVFSSGSKYLSFMDPEAQAEVKSLIGRNITDFTKDKAMNPVWQGIATYAQAFLTKAFLGTAENINLAESQGKTAKTNPLLINLLMNVMEGGEKHFRHISNMQKATGRDEAHTLTSDEVKESFASNGLLHPALLMDLNPDSTPEQRVEMRLEHFFKPLAKNLIALSGLDKSRDFPIPEALKDSGWELFQDKILPEVLMGLYNETLKPQNIVQIMSNLIDNLNLASESFEEASAEVMLPVDETQTKLNQQIGSLIKSFVDMLPTSASQTLFSIKQIKDMSSEAIGDIVRRKTNATSLLDVVNGLLSGITLTAPDVNDPRTPEEIARDDLKASKVLQSKLTTFISSQAKKTARDWITNKWDAFQKNFDNTVEKYLGTPGKAVKTFFDWVFGSIMRFIMPVLDFIVFRMIWALVDLHIWNKSGEIIKNSRMDIHENLAFKITEKATAAIKRQLEEVHREQELKKQLEEKAKLDDIRMAEAIKKKIKLNQIPTAPVA